MSDTLGAILLSLGLFTAILSSLEVGRWIGRRRKAREGEKGNAGAGAVDAAVFGLLGLLVAFTFSGAAARFDSRRQLIVQEANAIGTAYLRLDILPESSQAALRDDFRRYLEVRLAASKRVANSRSLDTALAEAGAIQKEIWAKAVVASREAKNPAVQTLVLSSLNEMIDITNTRAIASLIHPPIVVHVMLALLVLVGAFLAGFGMAGRTRRDWVHTLAFAAAMAATVYVIVDIEYPRRGLIRIDASDRFLYDLRDVMK